MNKEAFTTQDLIAELLEYDPPVKSRPADYGVTAMEYAKAKNVTLHWASDKLLKLHREGKYKREKMRDFDGQIRWIYYRDE